MERVIFKFGLSRAKLKWIALFFMVLDHIAFCFLSEDGPFRMWYLCMRALGRIAFPLFCFLLVQGFLSTGNVKKYFFRLFVFACISEIPYDLFAYHRLFSPRGQNVLFALCIALLVLYGISRARLSRVYIFLLLFFGSALAIMLRTDYSYLGILFTAVMYLWQEERFFQFVLLCVIMGMQGWLNPWEILSLPFMLLYRSGEGRQEKREEREAHAFGKGDGGFQGVSVFSRYFFYLFYPAHMLCLFLFDVFL
ncbi:MAG: hypothetical protein IJ733_07570 [Lachnospiraceae bacterium]|nr:hypothetical protein [Lachnospiraceae bacterium]